jgi:maltooligosyltrehalose trehalohydrolase
LTTRAYPTPGGAIVEANGGVRFRLWAPGAASVTLFLDGGQAVLPMEKASGGWHQLLTAAAKACSLYQYALPNGMLVPDPVSRFQPEDVHGPSEVIDPASYDWTVEWSGREWDDVVLYEHRSTTSPPPKVSPSAMFAVWRRWPSFRRESSRRSPTATRPLA